MVTFTCNPRPKGETKTSESPEPSGPASLVCAVVNEKQSGRLELTPEVLMTSTNTLWYTFTPFSLFLCLSLSQN